MTRCDDLFAKALRHRDLGETIRIIASEIRTDPALARIEFSPNDRSTYENLKSAVERAYFIQPWIMAAIIDSARRIDFEDGLREDVRD